jgi:hypothetical protein
VATPATRARRRIRAKSPAPRPHPAIRKARTKFLRAWQEALGDVAFRRLINQGKFAEIARLAIGIEAKTNLLFSFEKMALRDAVRSPAGAQAFATALFEFLHGTDTLEARFQAGLPPLRLFQGGKPVS